MKKILKLIVPVLACASFLTGCGPETKKDSKEETKTSTTEKKTGEAHDKCSEKAPETPAPKKAE